MNEIEAIIKAGYELETSRLLVASPKWEELSVGVRAAKMAGGNLVIQRYDLLRQGLSATPTISTSTRETR